MSNSELYVGKTTKHAGQDFVWNGSKWVLYDARSGLGVINTIGPAGPDGASAYELAREAGFTGTLTEYLDSLHGTPGRDGVDGLPGVDGKDGVDGSPGRDGVDGKDGASAYSLAVSGGFVGTQAQWLDSLKGAPGIPGAPGTPGTNGSNGSDGASAYALAVSGGFVGTQAQWLDSLKGTPGTNGTNGSNGANGQGVPTGGSTGQILAKTGNNDFQTGWIDAPTGSGGGSATPADAYDWTDARRVSVLAMEGGALAQYNGLNLGKKGNEAAKVATSGVYVQNKLDSVEGLYLQYTTSATRQMVGVSHQAIKYSRSRGYRIVHHFGIEQTGNNERSTFFMGLNNSFWPTDYDAPIYLCAFGTKLGVGFNENQANWQIVISGYGHTKYYVNTGIAKPTGTKILYKFEMKCEPGANLVRLKLVDVTNNVVIVDQFVEVYSDTDAGAVKIGTSGIHGPIGYNLHYQPTYFYSYYSTGADTAAPISYVFCRTYAETPG